MNPFLDDYADHFDVGFDQFKIRPGLELDVHDEAGHPLAHRAQFVMTHPGKGILFSIRANDPDKIGMHAGQRYQFSGFNGRFDFAFTAQAQKVDPVQFTALMAEPAQVTIRFVRRHERLPLALSATVAGEAGGGALPVTIRNLSLGGAGLNSIQPLGGKGDSLTLQLQITFEGQPQLLRLLSIIRRSGHSDASLLFETGLEFANPTLTDKLLLHYYLTTVANDYSVI